MSIPITNEPEILRVRGEVVAVARGMLSHAIGIVEGARCLAGLGHQLGADRDPDFTFFVGVDSETDHLPVGEVRRHWASDTLRARDEELRSLESFYRADAFRFCLILIKRYENTPAQQVVGGNLP